MEWLQQLITDNKIPLGEWARVFVDWLTTNYEWFFDAISNGLRIPIEELVGWLEFVPPLVFAVAAAAIAFLVQRSWKVALFILLGLLLILNIAFWDGMIATLGLGAAPPSRSL